MNTPRIDKQRLRRDFSQAAHRYDAAAVVQRTICDRALERVEMVKLSPDSILDIGVGTGQSLAGLRARFPAASILACDLALPMLEQCRRHRCTNLLICNDAERLPFKDGSINLIFSTSTFQWCADLNPVLSECRRVLSTDGVLIFSTFGPDTLWQLRNSWAQVDRLEHVHEFIDMHHIGDALLAHRFSDPVVDMEIIHVQYRALRQLLRDLKNTGSRGKFSTSASKVSAGLTSKGKYRALEKAYEQYRGEDGLLPASYEVIYGYARKSGDPRVSARPDEVTFPVSDIKRA